MEIAHAPRLQGECLKMAGALRTAPTMPEKGFG
jgi:hypothetical protein